MYPLRLDLWGGLASQLSSLAYAQWILDNTQRNVELLFHPDGTTLRSLEIDGLVKCMASDGRLTMVEDAFVGARTADRGTPKSKSSREFARLIFKVRLSLSRFLMTISPFHVKKLAVMQEDLRRIRPWTRRVYGYPLDWSVIETELEVLASALARSNFPNFLSEGGQDDFIAVHWRLGDYLEHANANETHGALSPHSICAGISALNAPSGKTLRIYTDSAEMARALLGPFNIEHEIEFHSQGIWDDLYHMSRARWFLGSHSAVSVWAAFGVRRGNPNSQILLPHAWFRTPPRSLASIPRPPFDVYAASFI